MVVTFYSYKGGVGRSMALANIARWLQLRGLDVIVVDWDLEAPGIESFFLPEDSAGDTLGLIDLLVQYRQLHANLPFDAATTDATPADRRAADLEVLRTHLAPLDHALVDLGGPGPGRLRLLPAGWRAGDRFAHYANSVQAFDWNAFYADAHGHAFFDWLRESLCGPGKADVLLIDSRTGVTEMGGVCTRQMADLVIVLTAPNRQNLDGAVRMADSFRRPEVMAERDERPLELIMVPSRVDVASSEVKIAFERDFVQQTGRFMPAELHRLRREFWDLRIPYVSKYAFLEQLAIGETDGDPDLQAAYRLIAAHMAWLAPESGRVRSLMRDELDRVFGSEETRVLVAPGRLFTRALESLEPDAMPLARRVLLRMVNVVAPDVGERPTPRFVAAEPFDAQHIDVLQKLTASGVVKRAPNTSTELYGLAQDEFLATREFQSWIDEDRDFLIWRQRLRTYMDGWEADGRQRVGLMRGSVLDQAVRWMDSRPAEDLWPDERAFILASREDATPVVAPAAASNPFAQQASPNRVYICYRRHDAQVDAAVLAQELRRVLGARSVFVDLDIAPGEDFQETIARQIGQATLVLVLIGPRWLDRLGQTAQTYDFVQLEIAVALKSNARVVPVLLKGARMPREDQLPENLKALARLHALQLDLGYNTEPQIATIAGLARQTFVPFATLASSPETLRSRNTSLLQRLKSLLR